MSLLKSSMVAILLVIASTSLFALSVDNSKPSGVSKSSPTTSKAKVEKVFIVKDGEYRSTHYQIIWQGQPAIVDDPINTTEYKEGEEISFLVMRHDMRTPDEPDAPVIISFHALPYSEHKRR